MLESFKYDQSWYDLTWRQQQSKGWRSTLSTIVHKKAGWTHAAEAIMQYELAKLEQPAQPDDATEHVNALGEFAGDMAQWLLNFASDTHVCRQTKVYQKNYQTSLEALQRALDGQLGTCSSRSLILCMRRDIRYAVDV